MNLNCLTILFIVNVIQLFVIVNYFFINLHQNGNNMIEPQLNLIDKAQIEKEIKPECPKVVSSQSEPLKETTNEPIKYEGVAATLILHAPTWFQRRYSMMVQNAEQNIPDNWVVQVFYTGAGQSLKGVTMNKAIARLIERKRLILTVIPPELLKIKKKKFELMSEKWLWENMAADKVLTFGGTSVICTNSPYSIENFKHFDYIGTPWGPFKGVGGDGGISIRNRQLMLQVINYELNKATTEEQKQIMYKSWGQEDIFFLSRIFEMQKKGLLGELKIASRNDTLNFGANGNVQHKDVFVVQGTLPGIEHMSRETLLGTCPEMNIFFPSLHDPNCFGAYPDSEKCAASICALKPKSVRKGGC